MRFLFAVTLWLICPAAIAQIKPEKSIEKDVIRAYRKILYNLSPNYNSDSLEHYKLQFRELFYKTLASDPNTLTYPFDQLREDINIHIASSDDSLFRIYSWDTHNGGTMVDFENIFQYRAKNRVLLEPVYDTSMDGTSDIYIPFYSQIFTLVANNKTYYLAIANGIYSGKDASQSIQIFTSTGNSVHPTPLISTKSGLTSSIRVDFDFFSVVERPERPLRLIKYNRAKRTIFIPIVDDKGKVTNHFILYKFSNGHFKYQGTE